MALLWSIKGREFFFNVPYLFLLLTDLRKAEVYAGLIKGEKADLIPVFSFLNQLCRGILSYQVRKTSRAGSDPTYTILSFQKLQH